MGAFVELEKGAVVTADGQAQSFNDAVDAGAYRYAAVRFRLNGIAGGAGSGSVKIQVKTATRNEPGEYLDIKDESDTTQFEFTVAYNDSPGDLHFEVSDRFARYLRWEVTGWTLDGGTNDTISFSIDLVLKN